MHAENLCSFLCNDSMHKKCLWILHWLIRQEIINVFAGLVLKKIKSDLDVVLTCLECKCFLM